MYAALFSVLFLIVGVLVGWIAQDKYSEFVMFKRHDFEELFEENPHPEIYDKNGKIYRGDYVAITFEPGYDPEQFDPEDIYLDEDY